MRRIWDKSWKRYLIVFTIVFVITFLLLGNAVDYFNDTVESNKIHPDTVIVKDKVNNGTFIVIDDNDRTYFIDNDDSRIYNKIEVGQTYKVIVKEPMQPHENAEILQVHNEASED